MDDATIVTINFGAGMEHIKRILGKSLVLINLGYKYGTSETVKIPVNELE